METMMVNRASRSCSTSPNAILKPYAAFPQSRRQWRVRSIRLTSATRKIFFKPLFPCQPITKIYSACQSCGILENECQDTKNENLVAILKALLKGLQRLHENKVVVVVEVIRRFMALAVVLLALGFVPLQKRALAAPAAVATLESNHIKKNEESDISAYKRELDEAVELIEKRLQEVRGSDDKDKLQRLEEAIRLLRAKTVNVRSNVLIHTQASVRRLKTLEARLLKQAEQLAKNFVNATKELDQQADENMKVKSENKVRDAENKFRAVWSELTKLEADLVTKETEGLRLAFRQIPAIQDRVDQLFQPKPNPPSTSEYERSTEESNVTQIRKNLEDANKKTWERIILPSAVDLEESELPIDGEKQKTLKRIKVESQKSREMQEELESLVRKQLKVAGEEKLLLVVTPQKDVVKGFPPVELKWLFGDKDVHVPRAASFHMAQGWKKWREEAKANLKSKLLEDVELGKKYIAERQERILLYRDRVITKTWYNENEKRWEMHPVAASYAVTKQLVARARIRHDWAKMYIVLKGDDKEYHVDIQEFDVFFEQAGGFDGLYVKMVTSAIPISVEFMWIPFKEWDLRSQIVIPIKVLCQASIVIWNSKLLSTVRTWYLSKLTLICDDIMVQEGFNFLYNLARNKLYDSIWFLEWRIRTEKRFERATAGSHVTQSRVRRGRSGGKGSFSSLFWWSLKLYIRSLFYLYPLLMLFRYLREKSSGVVELLSDVASAQPPCPEKAMRRGLINRFLKQGGSLVKSDILVWGDIKVAFDRMKRIRNPPTRLRDLAGIDAVKDEIIEIVTFLKSPKHFQEMGARAPRGILILGDRETPKQTLVLAIAAEAKVPLVEVKITDFIGIRDKVGQGPARVRELFQTARELAPLIIYMDAFDSFAAARGESNDVLLKFQDMRDHEAIINQLLVELDGFETQEGVVFIASAERPDAIDEALRRPGRMDRTITISLPTEKERRTILQSAAKGMTHGDHIDWEKVADKTSGLTASQVQLVPLSLQFTALAGRTVDEEELFSIYGWLVTISGVIPSWLKQSKWMKKLNEALIDRLGLRLTKEDMQSTVELMEPYDMINPGLELQSPPITWTRDFKLPHAVWAAGRGLVALLLPNFYSVDLLWLDPTSWKGVGFTKLTRHGGGDLADLQTKSRSYLEKELVLCFGSYVAARLLLPSEESNNLSKMEIEKARQIATRMVLEYGWGPDDNHMVYWTTNLEYRGNLYLGKDHKLELEAKTEKLFNMACDKAAELLLKNQRALNALVEHLLEHDVVNKQSMLRIMEENGAIQEPDTFMLITYQNYEISASMTTNGTGRFSETTEPATYGF
ncbi:probable inactive ATP-dependent zinc metalloprotease FTSHI 5, chloroplastic [Cryptomeria japonica]|uniref:probable inactive ATP-dependent zinc metalloprotease FTSHI 5, chloroplastic n=1 Tax=Cryptomeria japonica TaxID=3369 RepID=UPI0025ABC2AF|nr:probable inactive ATP-dependent zinc metalloprotease FTSHI 5, chloroplastic [Cryptomeria japonica]